MYPGDELHQEVQVWFVFQDSGKLCAKVQVAEFDPDEKFHGCVGQEMGIWSAMARYVNSGGNLAQMSYRMQELYKSLSHTDTPQSRRVPPGFYLRHTGLVWYPDAVDMSDQPDDDGDGYHERAEHIFFNPTTQMCFHWIEDVQADLRSMTDTQLVEEACGQEDA